MQYRMYSKIRLGKTMFKLSLHEHWCHNWGGGGGDIHIFVFCLINFFLKYINICPLIVVLPASVSAYKEPNNAPYSHF